MQSEPIGNVPGRRTTSLGGAWRALVDPFDTGLLTHRGELWRDGWFRNHRPRHPGERVEYDFDCAEHLHVPGDWNSQRPELLLYEGSVWYKREFDWSPEPGRRLFVHFGAANYAARVWLNGEPIGAHEGGFGPFACEATTWLREGANFLVVQVDNRRRADAVPTLDSDWWNYGGLTRDVLLLDLPETFVRDYRVQLESPGRVAGWVHLDGPRPRQRLRVRTPETGAETSVGTDTRGFARFAFDARLEPWAPGRPRLYEVEVAAETDAVRERIGFRRVETRGCLDKVRWHVSARPVIVSEFGAGALAGHHGDPGAVWTEEHQARVYEHQLRMLERIPALRGMSPWVLKDFRSPKRVLPGIQDFYNRKGLVSERGQRKLAFEVLRAHYADRAGRAPRPGPE
jgi:hypothetical protein